MKREAFKMFLKSGYEKEYERRHAAIWPELKRCCPTVECMITPSTGTKKPTSSLPARKRKAKNPRKIWVPALLYKMVGLYGRYHEGESRQFSGNHTPA